MTGSTDRCRRGLLAALAWLSLEGGTIAAQQPGADTARVAAEVWAADVAFDPSVPERRAPGLASGESQTHEVRVMSRRDDQRIANLAKKNASKVVPPKDEKAPQFDPTLRIRGEEADAETKRNFKEMKKREF